MPSYKHKDQIALTYENNKRRMRCEGQVILAALMNEALKEMTDEFNAALQVGGLLEIGGSREEMKAFLRMAAERHLGLSTSLGRGVRAIASK